MKLLTQTILSVFLACFALLSIPTTTFAEAAPTATMRIDVKVDQADVFWNTTYLTKDSSDFGKAAAVNLTWGIGDTKRQEQTQPLIAPGKGKGRVEITTEKGALINFQVVVLDADKQKHGTLSFQVRNNGQTEYITIAPPDFIEPNLTFGAPRE
ncbi:MAG: hypothetical protein E6713_12195 [Sporomusaceae bacterium]|nr:hypothetical protein [Sporomusaceae bacterium]